MYSMYTYTWNGGFRSFWPREMRVCSHACCHLVLHHKTVPQRQPGSAPWNVYCVLTIRSSKRRLCFPLQHVTNIPSG